MKNNLSQVEQLFIINDQIPQKIIDGIAEDTYFNWSFENENNTVKRISIVKSKEELKEKTNVAAKLNLKSIVCIIKDDKSYIEWLKDIESSYRVLVYNDDQNAFLNLLNNPSKSVCNSWLNAATSQAQRTPTTDWNNVNGNVIKALRESFDQWLQQLSNKAELDNELMELDESEFKEDNDGFNYFKQFPLIGFEHKNNWKGAINKFRGFKTYLHELISMGWTTSQAAGGQNLGEWYEQPKILDIIKVAFSPPVDKSHNNAVFNVKIYVNEDKYEELFTKWHKLAGQKISMEVKHEGIVFLKGELTVSNVLADKTKLLSRGSKASNNHIASGRADMVPGYLEKNSDYLMKLSYERIEFFYYESKTL
jgi:hypothetical protein